MHTPLTRALGITHPIIQAPMGGANATPPALVAAVSEAGGLGFVGAPYMSPAQIAETCAGVRALTSRPFGINLFAPVPAPPLGDPSRAVARLAPYHAALGIAAPAPPVPVAYSFDDQLAAALASDATVFSFTFGLLPTGAMRALAERGRFVLGTATTVAEAVALERSGVDAVVAQGSEAAAHRGTFDAPFEEAMVGTMALVPQVVDAVHVPVVASGGIMDGRGIVAALALGAAAAQMGTAFLTTDECGVTEGYKTAVIAARETATRVTRAFSGRPARGIVNRFMREVEGDDVLPFPYQNALTRPMRAAATAQDRTELLSLWAGQGAPLARRGPAGALVARLADEMHDTLRALGNETGRTGSTG